MTLDAKVKGIRVSEQYFKSEKEKVQKLLEDAKKVSQMLILSRLWKMS